MARVNSRVIGVIEIKSSTAEKACETFLTKAERPDWFKPAELKVRPASPTVKLEADLYALMSQLDDELRQLNHRVSCAISSAEA